MEEKGVITDEEKDFRDEEQKENIISITILGRWKFLENCGKSNASKGRKIHSCFNMQKSQKSYFVTKLPNPILIGRTPKSRYYHKFEFDLKLCSKIAKPNY